MAKDKGGHGSEARGGTAHSAGVNKIGQPAGKVNDAAMSVISGAKPGTGFSVTLDGRQPTGGHMVALPSRTQDVDPHALSGPGGRAIIDAFTAKNADVFANNPNMHVGGWLDPDTKMLSLDPSEHIQGRSAAVAAGIARNQKEIYDVKNKTTIKTGGTGK
jgi:hypothetical protein